MANAMKEPKMGAAEYARPEVERKNIARAYAHILSAEHSLDRAREAAGKGSIGTAALVKAVEAMGAAKRDIVSRRQELGKPVSPPKVWDGKAHATGDNLVAAELANAEIQAQKAMETASLTSVGNSSTSNAIRELQRASAAVKDAIKSKGAGYSQLAGKLAGTGAPAKRGGGRGRNDAGMRRRGNATPSVTIRKR